MKAFFRACLLVLSLAMPAAWSAEPEQAETASIDARFAGHYYLEGIMETGSELRLGEDGRFQWYFTYGALDLAATGAWKREGERIELAVEDFVFPPDYPQTRFERMRLRIDGEDLIPAWPWDDGAERGRYVKNR